MKFKRLLSFFIAILMLTSTLVGCNVISTDTEETSSETKSPIKEPTVSDTVTDKTTLADTSVIVIETTEALESEPDFDTEEISESTTESESESNYEASSDVIDTEASVPEETLNDDETQAIEETSALEDTSSDKTTTVYETTKPAETTAKAPVTTKPEEKTTSAPETTKPEETTTEEVSTSNLGAALEKIESYDSLDFSDQRFHILAIDGVEDQFNVTELEAEPLAESVYLRNLRFKEIYGVDVETTTMDIQMFVEHFIADTKSMGSYDIAVGYTTFHINLAVTGLLYNFLDLEPYIDLDAQWWDQGTKSFNIADSIWFMNGSFNYEDDCKTYCLMFNKEIAKKHYETADVFYDMVKNMDWTLEKMYEYAQNVSENIGSPEWDEHDKYGFVCTWEYGIGFFYSAELKFVKCEKGSDPALILDKTGIAKATDLLGQIKLLFNSEITYWPECGGEKKGQDAFYGGRSLFFGEICGYIIEANRTMEEDFGILPLPMYKKEQNKYITWAHGISSSMIIPYHVKDVEKFGLMLEGFNILSDYYVRPAFYDVVLTRKSVKDADSGPMLDIIFRGRVYDFAMYYTDLGLMHSFNNCVTGNHTGFATEYAKVKTAAAATLRNLTKRFSKL